MTPTVFDPTPCELGEGPMWNPEARAFFWFDIIGKTLHRSKDGARTSWVFDDYVSAAGWVDATTLLVATSRALVRFDTENGDKQHVVGLEADTADTRSNDGRADPQGGFWIGTMGLDAQKDAGGIYRFWKGELRCLYAAVTIPNSICFAPDGRTAYFTDTAEGQIMAQDLDPATGWPVGDVRLFVDPRADGLNPDGSVVDRDGCLWNAQWGASRVARYAPDGHVDRVIDLPTAHVTCPAFGGDGLNQMLITTARQGLDAAALDAQPLAGQSFICTPGAVGQAEHRVKL